MSRSQNRPDAQPLDELMLDRFLPYRLSVLSNRVSKAIAARYAAEFDLSIPEWRVIAVLGRCEAGQAASDIIEATEMDKVAISRAVARLIAKKRVLAQSDPADGRRQLLRLSAEGRRVYARIAPVALECEARLIALLTETERKQLDDLVTRLSLAACEL